MDRFRYTFQAMACENVIELFCDSLADADEAARLAVLEVARIEMKYSRYRDDSVVTVINRAAGHEPVSIDQETSQLLDYADVCYRQSDGLFDITSGVLRRVWTFKSGAMKSVPLPAELEPFLTLVDWSRVERQFFSDGAQIRLPLPGMQIDFGGFGKEYAADRAAAVLLGQGIHHAFVNMGGDVVVTGPQANAEPWELGIQHPRNVGEIIAAIPVSQGAVATSGDYERYVEIDGVRFGHLLNSKTGLPSSGLQSATVFAPTCLVAGSIATIAMLKAEHDEWLSLSGVNYFVVDGAGRVWMSPDLGDVMRTADKTSRSSKQ
jgi:FAD:protein FMN transferase